MLHESSIDVSGKTAQQLVPSFFVLVLVEEAENVKQTEKPPK